MKKLLFTFSMMLFIFRILAAPFDFLPYQVTQPDGTKIDCFVSGDEFFNFLHDADGYTIIVGNDGYYYYGEEKSDIVVPTKYRVGSIDPSKTELSPWSKISLKEYKKRKEEYWGSADKSVKAPHTGIVNNLVIFIKFNDQDEFITTRSVFDDRFNSSGISLKDYFDEVSYSKVGIESHHYPNCELTTNLSYQDQYDRNYYEPYHAVNNPDGYQNDNEKRNREHTLLKNAVIHVSGEIPADLIIDSDEDGLVDNTCFIVRGGNGEWSQLLWAHRWVLDSQDVFINGKRVYDYTFQPETQNDVQTLCHEMFHVFGAKDLYHYNSSGISPVGSWDLMESGFGHMGAYMKWRYSDQEWIETIPEINTSGTYTLNPISSQENNCYKIFSPYSNNEFFILEYRKTEGKYESNLPGSGLLVYRINSDFDGEGNAQFDGTSTFNEVYIYRPGGTVDINGNINNASFSSSVNRTSINETTSPSCFLHDGAIGGLDISNVTAAGNTISFDVNIIMPCIQTIINEPLTIDQWGNVTVDIIAPSDGEYYCGIWNAFGLIKPEWEWTPDNTPLSPNIGSDVVELVEGEAHTFTFQTKPSDKSGTFQFWIYKKGLLSLYWPIDKVRKLIATTTIVDNGLAYLASIQSTAKGTEQQTGSSIDPYNIPEQGDEKIAGHWSGNPGITALCLQAFLANGHGADDPLYGTNVSNAITYILSQQIKSGYHLGAFYNTGYGYGTAMAIVALDAALKSGTLVEPLLTQVTNAVNLALNYYTQDVNPAWTNVSWRYDRSYTSQLSGDMSVNQWVFLALNAKKYTDKDIWNKIYGYINTRKGSSGGRSWIGYTSSSGDWIRGNTCAGVWGLKLAQQNGVVGADALSQQMYNYLEQYSLTELFAPASISTHVYTGGGYYYYIYELAKALALGGKTNFSGANWYEHMYNKIDSQKKTNASGNYYWDEWGGQGAAMETAQALLSLQVGTVPVGSKIGIVLTNAGGAKSGCLEFSVSDEFGNTAGMLNNEWYTDIPNSEWISTGDEIFELVVYLERATSFSTLIINNCGSLENVNLAFSAYIENNISDTEEFDFEVNPSSAMGASAFVNAIGGLNIIIIDPPSVMPILAVAPAELEFNVFNYNNIYNFEFEVKETGGATPLANIDIFSQGLSDENGNFIPGGNFSFSPSTITNIPPGGSVTVNGTLITPATLPNPTGVFQGLITAQTNQQAKAIQFVIGSSVPLVYNVTGGGGYCIGAVPTGVSVGLNGSQGALQYQLFRNNNAFGTPVNGTGTSLIWNNVPSGTYTVGAVTGASYFMMDGSVQVIEQLPVAIGVEIVADQNGVCTGTEVNFVAYPENSGTSPAFLWNVNDIFTGVYGTEYSYIPANGDVVTLLMVTNNYCTTNGTAITSQPIAMVVHPNLTVGINISTNQSNIVEGSPVTLTANPINGGINPVFQWKVNGNNIGSNTNTLTYTPVNNDAVSCVLSSSEMCVVNSMAISNTIIILVQPPSAAIVNIVASSNNVCAGTAVSFTASTVNAGTNPDYQWKVNGTVQPGNLSTFSYTPLNGDIISLTIHVNNGPAAGTTANSNQIGMIVQPLLPVQVTVSSSLNNMCEGTNVTFTASPVNGGLSPSFVWYVNDVSRPATGPVYTYQPQNEDNVNVQLTSSVTCAANNPALSNTVEMIVNPKLTPGVTIIADNNNICLGTSVTFNATAVNGGDNPVYYWYVNDINLGGNNTSFTYVPNDGDEIQVILISNQNCLTENSAYSNILTISVINPEFALVIEPEEAGSATFQGNIGLGYPVLLNAMANTGWVFSHWSDQNGNVITNSSTTVYFISECFTSLTANFSWETRLIGQLKFFNESESIVPSPNQNSVFYAQLFDNGEPFGEKQLVKFNPQNELESSYEFRVEEESTYTIRVWEESMITGLQNSWSWNNWGGVTALDALIVNYMVIQNPVLENYPWIVAPNQKLDYTSYFSNVADANNSNTITSLDALMLLYRMVNYPNTSPFPGGRHNFQFAGKYTQSLNELLYPLAPDIQFTVNGSYTANSPTSDIYYEAEIPAINQGLNVFDTYMVATGDLNVSYSYSNPAKSDIALNYEGIISVSKSEELWVPFKILQQAEVGAITLDIKYDNSLIEVLDLSGFEIFTIDQVNGIIKIAWMDINGRQYNPGDELLLLKIKALSDLGPNTQLFDILTSSEFADRNASDINGVWLSTYYVETGMTMLNEMSGSGINHAVYPNPFIDNAQLKYVLPEAGKVKITIYNYYGQEIMVLHEANEMAGAHNLSISNQQFKSNGAYFYRIELESVYRKHIGKGAFILF